MYERVKRVVNKSVNELLSKGADPSQKFDLYLAPENHEGTYLPIMDEEGCWDGGNFTSELGVTLHIKVSPQMTTTKSLVIYDGPIARSHWENIPLEV